ncbi:MAG TPA: cell division protein FtsZ [Fibrobacteria bacterium]|jgi:cell division protein FtsZ|nr:cell division protein FtsZ [Fibrobacteria bacterium]
MMFELDNKDKTVAKLKVIGVGGAGGNAINRMIESGLQGVEFIALNTDAKAMQSSKAELRIQIGNELTKGLGAGGKPEIGMNSMLEDVDRLRNLLEGADMVFIAAGMGGGTGTGAAPVVADLARSMGILTVAVVTKPFTFEGRVRDSNANMGLDNLRQAADTVIVVPNQKLISVVPKGTPMKQAFMVADDVLSSATRGISEIILKNGEVNVDFADVRTIMAQGGEALMGTGRASGENRAQIAADRAIHSPLLDNINISGATGVLVNITGGEDMSIDEIDTAMNYLYEAVGQDANTNIIMGTVVDPSMVDEISVTVIATGFGTPSTKSARAASDMFRTRPGSVAGAPAASAAPAASVSEVERVSLLPQAPEPRARAEDVRPASSFAPQSPQGAGKAPFGARTRPAAFPPASPAPRHAGEERPSMQETGAAAARSNNLFSGLFGNPKADSEPDIDYETPAFLRNQAD